MCFFYKNTILIKNNSARSVLSNFILLFYYTFINTFNYANKILIFFKKGIDKAVKLCYNLFANPKTVGYSNCVVLPTEEKILIF
jgi:hypothetical protein